MKKSSQNSSHSKFSIMPNRMVEETLTITEFFIEGDLLTAKFNRTYSNQMRNSPSHLTLTTIPLQTQKLGYLLFCSKLGIDTTLEDDELFKIWPNKLDIQLDFLINKENDLIQTIKVIKLDKLFDGSFDYAIESTVESKMRIYSEGKIFII